MKKEETDDKPNGRDTQPFPSLHQARILVVDDDPAVRETLVLLLAAAGYETASAGNGFEALQQLKKETPAVLLCDLEMPGMSGYELLSIVRRRFPGVAVIAMSGSFAGDGVPESATADAFYGKGQRKTPELFRIVAEVVRNSAARLRAHEMGPAPIWGRWIGTDARGTSYVLVTCADCLRSFPVVAPAEAGVQQASCRFCKAEIQYITDPSMASENLFNSVFPLLIKGRGAYADPGRGAPPE